MSRNSPIDWSMYEERASRLVPRFGWRVTLRVFGLPDTVLNSMGNHMRRKGIKYAGPMGRRTESETIRLVQEANAWEAAGFPEYRHASSTAAPKRDSGKFRFAPDATVVGLDTAPVHRAAPMRDRFDPGPAFRGDFSKVNVGRDVRTGEAWK